MHFLLFIPILFLAALALSCWDAFNDAYNERWKFGPRKIAFVRSNEIYTIDENGNNLTRLTYTTAADSFPSWSGDGTRIVFQSSRDGNQEIYVMKWDGTQQTRLTYNTVPDYYPSISPDGARIVFMRNIGTFQLFTINSDGSNEQQLTSIGTSNDQPKWSPDGTRIVFQSNRSGTNDIWVMNVSDPANPLQLTSAVGDGWPNWSADGSLVLFARGGANLYSIKADGSDNYTPTVFVAGGPFNAWSPDGAIVMFTRAPDIYFINPDGTGERLFLTNANIPCWSPF